jgi:hypothetical protein
MALPIKPKDTQEGCNPISSNCVIWQGPDIPCIKLCTGDSVSDTVAKLAEELCTITDQLNISVLDISCFGAIAPEPGTFADVIQILINKTCTVEAVLENNGFDLDPNTSTCPDDCLVSVALCLQPTDPLGNVITELPLRDYIILVGTRICTIVAEVNTLTSAVTDLQNRVTSTETEIQNIINGGLEPETITSGFCIGGGVEKTIETFLLDFEQEYCRYTAIIGTTAEVNNALNGQCAGLAELPQLANPRAIMANIPGWVPEVEYTALADAVSNLWRTVCDMREALITLQAANLSCCGPNCSDVDFGLTASGVRAGRFIDIYFSGDVPAEFTIAGGAGTPQPFAIIDAFGHTGVAFNPDIVTSINSGAVFSVDISGNAIGPVLAQSVWYAIGANLQVTTDTGLTCNNSAQYEFYNENWCQDRSFALIGTNVNPNVSGGLTLTWNAASADTTYNISLYEYVSNDAWGSVIFTDQVTYNGGARTYVFPGLYSVNNRYKVKVVSQQSSAQYGLKEISCETDIIRVPN